MPAARSMVHATAKHCKALGLRAAAGVAPPTTPPQGSNWQTLMWVKPGRACAALHAAPALLPLLRLGAAGRRRRGQGGGGEELHGSSLAAYLMAVPHDPARRTVHRVAANRGRRQHHARCRAGLAVTVCVFVWLWLQRAHLAHGRRAAGRGVGRERGEWVLARMHLARMHACMRIELAASWPEPPSIPIPAPVRWPNGPVEAPPSPSLPFPTQLSAPRRGRRRTLS